VTERHSYWAPVVVKNIRRRLFDPTLPAEELISLAARLSRFAHHEAVVQFVAETLRDPKAPEHTKVAFLQVVAAGSRRQIPAVWNDALLEMLAAREIRPQWRTVSTLRGLTGVALDGRIIGRLQELAANAKAPEPFRLEALATAQAARSLAHKGQPSTFALTDDLFAFLLQFLSREHPLTMRLQVADILAGSQLSPAQRGQVCDALGHTGPVELMRLLASFKPPRDAAVDKKLLAVLADHAALVSLDPTALKAALAGLDPSLAGDFDKLQAKIAAANEDKLRQITAMLEKVKHGNVARGQQVFFSAKASC
jgi:hypothetical protein